MFNVLKVMADNKLDAIVHQSIEHQPTLVKEGVNPPWVNTKETPHLNTFPGVRSRCGCPGRIHER